MEKEKRTLKEWFLAINPWALPASAMPALAAVSYVFYCWFNVSSGTPVPGVHPIVSVSWWLGLAAFVGCEIFHASGNTMNDYVDYTHGVDTPASIGVNRSLISGRFKPKEIFIYSMSLMAVACLIGLLIAFSLPAKAMWELIAIGVIGALLTYFYTYLKYLALGDLVIFIVYGLLVSQGMFLVMTHSLCWPLLLVSAPIGLWVVNILHCNNTRDRATDSAGGCRTRAYRLGTKGCIIMYDALGIVAYVLLFIDACLEIVSWTVPILALASLPAAVKLMKKMEKCDDPQAIFKIDAETAQFVILFAGLIILGNLTGVLL